MTGLSIEVSDMMAIFILFILLTGYVNVPHLSLLRCPWRNVGERPGRLELQVGMSVLPQQFDQTRDDAEELVDGRVPLPRQHAAGRVDGAEQHRVVLVDVQLPDDLFKPEGEWKENQISISVAKDLNFSIQQRK